MSDQLKEVQEHKTHPGGPRTKYEALQAYIDSARVRDHDSELRDKGAKMLVMRWFHGQKLTEKSTKAQQIFTKRLHTTFGKIF